MQLDGHPPVAVFRKQNESNVILENVNDIVIFLSISLQLQKFSF